MKFLPSKFKQIYKGLDIVYWIVLGILITCLLFTIGVTIYAAIAAFWVSHPAGAILTSVAYAWLSGLFMFTIYMWRKTK